MNIPNFVETKMVDKNGNLTTIWKQILMQLITEMQTSLSEEGFKIPQQTTSDIGKIVGTNTVGHIIYDKTLDQLKVNIGGTMKVVQVV